MRAASFSFCGRIMLFHLFYSSRISALWAFSSDSISCFYNSEKKELVGDQKKLCWEAKLIFSELAWLVLSEVDYLESTLQNRSVFIII